MSLKDNIKNSTAFIYKHLPDKSLDKLTPLEFSQIKMAMKEYTTQFIDIAAEEATFKTEEIWSWGDSWKETIIDKESILKVKQLIK